MPGVPSGRACEACRKQKKKCDEAKPTCSRCKRLQIACIGSGKPKFRFKDQNRRFPASEGQTWKITTPRSEEQDYTRPICYSPSNDQSRLTLAFIEAVRLSTDLKYSLSWAYGAFLADVPKRLGTNKALDAASRALVTSHLCFSSPGRVISSQALSEYTQAISALRTSLDDLNEACSATTLGAINILLITQGFIGVIGNRSISHCQGAAQILKARGIRCSTQDEFERALFVALRGPILFEGLFNRKIHFTRHEWEQLVQNDFDKLTGTGLMMQCLARVPDIVKRGRQGFKNGQIEEVSGLRNEAQNLYDGLLKTVDELRKHYGVKARHRSPFPEISDQVFSARLYAHWQRTYGLALTIAMFFNCILHSLILVPNQTDTLGLEAAYLVAETIAVAENAVVFRPLGSSYIVLCLVAGWSCAATAEAKMLIEELLEDYLSDFPRRQEQTEFDLGVVARHFDLRHDDASVDVPSISSGGYRIC